ncbi:MAG: carboxynorspermidine decarboxylase [Bdellovibrionales bacterium RBG_16_40_8]|nr:MAG: carboxynorspermidine decarboxylase [Bdellovibrionales bacterium RBG_16_40_8]
MLKGLDLKKVPSPCYIVNIELLKKNLKILNDVQINTGCKIILALKGFAMWGVFPLIREYLPGVTASSADEVRLGFEEFGREVHVCSPAYSDKDFNELIKYVSHITFNSFSQWEHFQDILAKKTPQIKCGIRINPEHSEVKTEIYDPCQPNSRLGVKLNQFKNKSLKGITGLHFHTLCELNSDSLKRTLDVVEHNFGQYLNDIEWVNFGGGHHITRSDYDIKLLCKLITDFKNKYNVEVILEPGEAIALNTGALLTTVLDIVKPLKSVAILDASAAAHMPDVIEMPYRPNIVGAGLPQELEYNYILGGPTCLAGDNIGEYSFAHELQVGDHLELLDMAHYSMVKNNTFNGVRLPSIGTWDPATKKFTLLKKFSYEDYKGRLS